MSEFVSSQRKIAPSAPPGFAPSPVAAAPAHDAAGSLAGLERADRLGHRFGASGARTAAPAGSAPVQRVRHKKKPTVSAAAAHAKHKRRRTAFGYTSGTTRQGPHSLAHVAVGTALSQGASLGRPLDDLLDTRAAPRTRIVNKLLRTEIPGKPNKKGRHRLLEAYRKARHQAKKGPKKGRAVAIEKLLASNPLATYGSSTGAYTPAEISGKGERTTHALADLPKLAKLKKSTKGKLQSLPSGVKTFDTRKGEVLNHERLNFARTIGKYASTSENLSDGEDIGSESDTDLDLDSDLD